MLVEHKAPMSLPAECVGVGSRRNRWKTGSLLCDREHIIPVHTRCEMTISRGGDEEGRKLGDGRKDALAPHGLADYHVVQQGASSFSRAPHGSAGHHMIQQGTT